MNVEITANLLGEDGEAELTSWVVDDGVKVERGDVVASIETAKASVEVSAPQDGVLRHQAAEGDMVEAGPVIGGVA